MLEITPSRFFKFAAEHHSVLEAVHYRRNRIGEAELLTLIRKHAGTNSPTTHHTLAQLLQLGFLEIDATATAEYEMTRHVSNLFDVLLRQHRLTSVQVIQAYVDDICSANQDLHENVSTGQDAQTARVLIELSDSIERLRQDSRNNRDAIIAAAVRAKVNAEQATVQERFVEINRLWEKYIVPLRDMVDASKVLDVSLDALEEELQWCRTEAHLDQVLVKEIRGVQGRLMRMRREVNRDFRESIREISPLYHDLRRDTRLVRGAALALDQVDRLGRRTLALPDRLALPVWRQEGQLDDEELRAYLYQVRNYKPRRPDPLPTATGSDASDYIEPEELTRRLANSLPIADAWIWLLQQYPQAATAQILRAHARILRGDCGLLRQMGQPKCYRTATHEIIAVPLEVVPYHE